MVGLFPCFPPPGVSQLLVLCASRPTWGGACPGNLRLLPWAKRPAASPELPALLRMALINARSVVNKTFIINDFFSARHLDLFD